jgi:nitrilase
MGMNFSLVKVAVIQKAPVLFNKKATLDETVNIIQEVAREDVQLALFPEAYIPAYPRGLSFGTVIGSRSDEGREIWQLYWENAINIPGKTTKIIGEAVKKANIYLAIGVIEKDLRGKGTLYCSILYFAPDGQILGKHQKLKPTAAERIIWGEGDGTTLTVLDTDIGRIGGLICWENYMPLARMSMYNKGVDIYLAPTADARESWQSTLKHIACEGRCFVLGCNQYVTKSMYPQHLPGIGDLAGQPEILCRGGSVIVSPMGKTIAGPLLDREGILYADLNFDEIIKSKMDFDVIGHYSRPDVFKLDIIGQPNNIVYRKNNQKKGKI